MPMVLLVIDQDALTKVEDEANSKGVRYDTLLNQRFQEFLVAEQFKPAPVVEAQAAPEPIDIRDAMMKELIGAARVTFGDDRRFVFNDLVPLVPELAALPQQERTTFASLFARRYADFNSGIVKIGKNSSKATEYGFA